MTRCSGQEQKIGAEFQPHRVEETKVGVQNLTGMEAPVNTPGSVGSPGSYNTDEEQTPSRYNF